MQTQIKIRYYLLLFFPSTILSLLWETDRAIRSKIINISKTYRNHSMLSTEFESQSIKILTSPISASVPEIAYLTAD